MRDKCCSPGLALCADQEPAARRAAHLAVYKPEYNEWLLRLSHEAARALRFELAAHKARSVDAAARLYQTTIGAADGKRDTLWLPSDVHGRGTTIMPLVLRASWNGHVPIFSSSFSHIGKGVLLSLYPNNVALGRALSSLATDLLVGHAAVRGVTPLRDGHAALNLRTASHFGITLDASLQRAFGYDDQ